MGKTKRDGVDGIDTDQDGVASISSGGTDCDNNNPEIFPVQMIFGMME